ncbi:MAG: PAS domain-containing sensor histidine kinase [Caldilineaceae bacterium]|nr:PAS domain-containing sensor histidine kinase [Caldilineaceae bacterium]
MSQRYEEEVPITQSSVSARLLQETFEKVEQAKQEWEATMDALPQLICLIDEEATIWRANRAVERWRLGVVTRVKGRKLHELLHPECDDPNCTMQRFLNHALRHSSTSEMELYDRHLQRYIQIKVQPVDVRNRMRSRTSAVIVNDVTQLKAAEEGLRLSNESLHRALQAKQEMLQNVSHELRTPLALIHGYTHLLKDEVLGPLSDEQQDALTVLQERTEYLKGMIEQLLLLQSISSEHMHKTTVELVSLIQTAIRQTQAQALKRKIRLEWLSSSITEVEILADGTLLIQALINIIDNAIKFSYEDNAVLIQMVVTTDEVVIAISDQGVGISQEKQRTIFEEFSQGNGSMTRVFGGMGAGLALCQKIAEAHGGRVWAESAGEGLGSTFYLALPTSDVDEDAQQTPPAFG